MPCARAILAVSIASLLAGQNVKGAAISWSAPTTIASDTDVLTAGLASYAYTQSNIAAFINGVTFTGVSNATALGTDVTMTGFTGINTTAFTSTAAPFSALGFEYQNLLRGATFNGGAAANVTLGNLTAGHSYAVQYWISDPRAGATATRTATLTSGGGNTVTLAYNTAQAGGGLGQYSVGYFTADGTTQVFTVDGNASTQMNALQLRDVTNIGYWVGSGGATWDEATTANFAINSFGDALTTVDYTLGKAPLNGVTFADTYWNSGVEVPVTQTTVNVAAGGVGGGRAAFTANTASYTVASADALGISGTTAISKSGLANLTLLGAHSYTGGTTVGAGVLNIGTGAADGSITGGGSLSIGTGASVVFNSTTASTVGVLSGTGTLTKQGTGTLTLTGNSTFTGTTNLSGGVLRMEGTYAASPAPFTIGNATLELHVASGLRDYATATFNGTGTLRKTGAGTAQWSTSAATFALGAGSTIDVQEGIFTGGSSANENWISNLSSLNVAAGAEFHGVEANVRVDTITGEGIVRTGFVGAGYQTLTIGVNNGSGTFSGVLANNAAPGNVTKIGTGTQIFAGANTYTGTTTINDGTLKAGIAGTAFGNNSAVTLANAANAVLDITGFDNAIGSLAGGGTTGGNVTLGAATLTVGGNNTSTIYAGIVSGTGGLAKTGTGALTLTGTNTYTGSTSVDSGTLIVNGSLAAGSAVGVNSGTLSGTGNIFGTATIDNLGRLSPGTATISGALTFGGLVLNPGSFVDMQFGVVSDAVAITAAGGLVINGGGINLYAPGGTTPLSTPGTYTLFTYNTSFGGSLANLTVPAPAANTTYSVNDTGSAITITLASVTPSDWTGGAANGLWTDALNWSAGVPDALGAVANFGAAAAAPTSVALNGPKTVGNLLFDNGANSYTLTGGAGDVLTLDNGIAGAVITVASGSHVIAAPITVTGTLNSKPAAGTTLTISGDLTSARPFIQNGAGTTIVAGANNSTTIDVEAGTLRIGTGGTAGTLGTGAVKVAPGAMLTIDRSDTVTIGNTISGGGGITLAGGGIFTLTGDNNHGVVNVAGSSLEFTGISTIGTVNLTSGTTAFAAAGSTISIVNVNGGTATLTGTNTIASVNLTGGTLVYVSGAAIGGRVPNMSGTATLELNGSSAEFDEVITGQAGNTIVDSGTEPGTSILRFRQANNLVRTTAAAIKDGPVRKVAVEIENANAGHSFTNGNSTFSGGITLLHNAAGGTRLRVDSTLTTVGAPGAIVSGPFGTGTITIGLANTDRAGIYILAGNNSIFNDIVFNTALGTDTPGIRVDALGVTFAGTITANLSDAVFSSRTAANNSTAFITGRVTGAGGFTLDNTFNNLNVMLNNSTAQPNDYAGATTIGGTKMTLSLGGAEQIPHGAAAGNLVNNGTLNLGGFSETVNGLTGNGAVDAGGGTPTFTIGANDATSVFGGVLRNSAGTLAVGKVGAGTVSLNGASTFNGGLTISAGTISAGNASALGDPAVNVVTVQNGASLNINGQRLDGYLQPIRIEGEGVLPALGALGNSSATTNQNAIRAIALTGDASIGGDGARWDIGRIDFNADPAITTNHIDGGGFVLTKVGTSYLGLLAGATNLAGFVIDGGTVAPHENTSFGEGPVALNNGATIQPWGGTTIANPLAISAGTLQNDGFTDTYTGPVAVNGPLTINLRTTGNIVFNGNMTGTGPISKVGGTDFVLAGDNSGYSGTMTITTGSLLFSSATASSASAAFALEGGTIASTVTGPSTHRLGSLSGVFGTLGNNAADGAVTFEIGSLNTDTIYSGIIQDSFLGPTTSIVKLGTGSLTLGGFATHTGGTEVRGGALLVTGSIFGDVDVKSGARLGSQAGALAGSVGSIAVESGGILAPGGTGSSIGVLGATGSLTLEPGAAFSIEIGGIGAGTGHDQLSVAGDVTLADAVLSLSGTYAGGASGDIFTIILNDGFNPVTGAFAGLPNLSVLVIGAQGYQISYFDNASTPEFETAGGNDVSLLAVVPEPGSAATLCGLAFMLGLRRRRHASRF